jgi:CRISPR-associated protein Cas5d
MNNQITFKTRSRYALFTNPITKIGGEKCSYHIPTYEALKGIVSSIYWKPTFTWVIDKVRIMKPIRTESKSVKPLKYGGGNDLATYTYLVDVEYQVVAHFEWNLHREDMINDRIDGKHFSVAQRMIEKGGRRDIFLGARECQGYIEPCTFLDGNGFYDGLDELSFGLMFHGFDYPDTTGQRQFDARFWKPVMRNGVIQFLPPQACTLRKNIRNMSPNPPRSIGLLEEGLFE